MATVINIVTGDDTNIWVNLTKNGIAIPVNSGSVVQASLTSKDKRTILIPPVAVLEATIDSDWANGLLIVEFTSAQTNAIPTAKLGTALLEVQVDDGGKLTWFTTVKLLQGTIDQ